MSTMLGDVIEVLEADERVGFDDDAGLTQHPLQNRSLSLFLHESLRQSMRRLTTDDGHSALSGKHSTSTFRQLLLAAILALLFPVVATLSLGYATYICISLKRSARLG